MIRRDAISTVTDPRKIFSYMLTYETNNRFGGGREGRRREEEEGCKGQIIQHSQ